MAMSKEAPISEHIEELVHRINVALIALIICSILCIPLVPHAVKFMRKELLPSDIEVVALNPFDNIIALFEVAFTLGFILAFPVILYEALKFITPALYGHELKLLYWILPLGLFLFLLGVLIGFKLILPTMYAFCSEVLLGQSTIFSLRAFIEYTILLLLSFGVAFELPLIMAMLSWFNIASIEAFKENRMIAYIVLALIGIILLTPEATTLLDVLATALMIGLYELGIFISAIVKRKNRE